LLRVNWGKGPCPPPHAGERAQLDVPSAAKGPPPYPESPVSEGNPLVARNMPEVSQERATALGRFVSSEWIRANDILGSTQERWGIR